MLPSYVEEMVSIATIKQDDRLRNLVPANNMREQLVASISKNGQTLPIDVDQDYVVLDGYTRLEILKELKYTVVKVRKWGFRSSEDQLTAYIISAMLNLQRRHLEKNEVLRLISEISQKIQQLQKPEPIHSDSPIQERPDYHLMKKVRDEIQATQAKDQDIQRYSRISEVPILKELVDKGKLGLRLAYDVYLKIGTALNNLPLPKEDVERLLLTKEGRKILMDRHDLLEQIVHGETDLDEAIQIVEVERKSEPRPEQKPQLTPKSEPQLTPEQKPQLTQPKETTQPQLKEPKETSILSEQDKNIITQLTDIFNKISPHQQSTFVATLLKSMGPDFLNAVYPSFHLHVGSSLTPSSINELLNSPNPSSPYYIAVIDEGHNKPSYKIRFIPRWMMELMSPYLKQVNISNREEIADKLFKDLTRIVGQNIASTIKVVFSELSSQ